MGHYTWSSSLSSAVTDLLQIYESLTSDLRMTYFLVFLSTVTALNDDWLMNESLLI
jgi:hypothetical protein